MFGQLNFECASCAGVVGASIADEPAYHERIELPCPHCGFVNGLTYDAAGIWWTDPLEIDVTDHDDTRRRTVKIHSRRVH